MATGWKVDLIVRKNRPFSAEELQRRVRGNALGLDVAIASIEDSIVSKLEWPKQGEAERQLRDVRELVTIHGDRLDRSYIEHWVRELELQDLWASVQG